MAGSRDGNKAGARDAVRQTVTTEAQETQAAPEALPLQVSVILITRNQAVELRRALAALDKSALRERTEIHVVDCGSQDGALSTRDVAAEFPSAQVLYLPDNFGATKALNIAVRSAKAEVLFFLSPNVEVAADTITQLLEKLESAKDTAAVCPLLVAENGQPAPLMQAIPTKEILAKVCAGEPAPIQTLDQSEDSVAVGYPGRYALLIRKQFIVGMNYFDVRFGEYWADADLALQARRAQRKIRVYPAIRAAWHEPAAAQPLDTEHISDRFIGAATLLSKHEGFLAGLAFRLSAVLNALIRFRFDLLGALLSGKKLGSHAN